MNIESISLPVVRQADAFCMKKSRFSPVQLTGQGRMTRRYFPLANALHAPYNMLSWNRGIKIHAFGNGTQDQGSADLSAL
jgi:hypothetical protein